MTFPPLSETTIKRIAYYISAHGYGHATRSAVVLAKLLRTCRVEITSAVPAEFFDLYLKDNFTLTREPVDAGCVHGDFIHIDAEKTLQKAESFYADAEARLQREVRRLEEKGIDLILTDIASLPLKAGKRLGIPTVLIANFTWHDIYSHLPNAGDHKKLLEKIRDEYAEADLQILPQCHLENEVVQNQKEVGFIAMRGNNVRPELADFLGIPLENKTLVFIYLGQTGNTPLQWPNLENPTDCVFVTRDALPKGIRNLHVLDERFRYPDLIASSDLTCTKAGYSTLATAFAHGKPVISCGREHFHEFDAMRDFLYRHRVGSILEPDRFYSCRWGEDIKNAREMTVKGKVKMDGEEEVVRIVEEFLAK